MQEKTKSSKNSYADAMRVIGVLIIVFGIIGSFYCGYIFGTRSYYSYTYNITVALAGTAGSIILGSLFLGLSEIIYLLQGIKDGNDRKINQTTEAPVPQPSAKTNELKDIEENLPEL